MSSFALSYATVCGRRQGRDEILECFKYAPVAGYRYWGLQSPTLWTFGHARWLNTDLLSRLATQAGLLGCTEVYGPQFPIGCDWASTSLNAPVPQPSTALALQAKEPANERNTWAGLAPRPSARGTAADCN